MGLKNWLTTLGLGAGLMYFYDPEQGDRRRAKARDQWIHLRHDAEDYWDKAVRDLQNRAQGFRSQPISMKGGVGGLGGLQGSWSPGIRLLAGGAGAILSLYGLIRGGFRGILATIFGLNLVSRSITDKDLSAFVGMRGPTAEGAIDFNKSLNINAPVDEVFSFWRNYDNFPQFMSHLREVKDIGNGRSHWVAEGPAGTKVEWDAVITEMQPNRLLAWESLPGSQVHNAGSVRFQETAGTTRVDVHMKYVPPAGALGHAVAKLFGDDPKSAMDEDMLRFKSLVETGETTAESMTVTREQVETMGQRGSQGMAGAAEASDRQMSREGATWGNTPEQGLPGGQTSTDEVGQSGVYPASEIDRAPDDAEVHGMASWGQGARGAAGYDDSGGSELNLGPEPYDRPETPPVEDEQRNREQRRKRDK